MEYLLNDGLKIPAIGLGTYKMPDDDNAAEAVAFALQNGYSSIDCASYYSNQKAVGKGIAQSGRQRSDIFVTSKVWRDEMGYDSTLRSFETTLKDLGTDYLDMYLLHWPTTPEENRASWRALTRLKEEAVVKSIGVSNFEIYELADPIEHSDVVPAVDQIQYNPEGTHPETVKYCKDRDILIEAWAPLARGRVFSQKILTDIAQKHHKSVAQICLRWEIQNGVRPIPKSSSPQRILENINIFDFTLSPAEMQAIDQLRV